MTALLRMARWAHALRIEHAPVELHERLRVQAASVLGAAAASMATREAAPVLAAARAHGEGALLVAPGAGGLGMHGALLAGSALSSAHQHDDWMLCGHTGHSAVWAAWLGAAELGLSWDEALRAQLAANELLGRLGGLCLAGGQAGRSPAFLHAVGGALVGGLLRGLTPDQLAAAMGLALAQASQVDPSLFGTSGRLLAVARPLLDGWRMSEAVQAGLDGPVDLLEGDSAFLAAFAGGRPVRGWLSGLGGPDATGWLTWSLGIKCAPGGATLGAAIEAMQEVLAAAREARGREIEPADILRIDVDTGALNTALERLLGASAHTDPASLRLATQRAMATVVLAGTLGPEQAGAAWQEAHSTELDALTERIRLHHDWRLTLETWNALRAIGLDALLGEVGAGPLLAAAGRSGGLEAGLALTELPLALAGERLQTVQPDELPALLARGIGRLTEFAARRFERLLPAPLTEQRAQETPSFDLGAQPLAEISVPLPARVRVLLHGGHVHQAAVSIPRGAPGRDASETRAAAREKLLAGLLLAAPDQGSAHQALIDGLLGAGNTTGVLRTRLPGRGPAQILRSHAAG